MNRTSFWTILVFLAICVMFVMTYSVAQAILYEPGETLNPACAPTDVDCDVIPPATAGVNNNITELGSLTHVTSTNAVFTYATSTQLYVNGLLFESMNGVSVTSTHAFLTNLTFGSATGTSMSTVDLSSTGLSSLATTTIMNGFLGIGTSTPQSALHLTSGSFLQTVGSDPTIVGSLDLPPGGTDVYVAGKYAYVTTWSTGDDFHIIDISNPTAPIEVGSLDLPDAANGVHVSGRYAYVVTGGIGDDFHIIDISNPTAPIEVGSLDLPDAAWDVYISGQYAYVVTDTTGDDFHIIDISDPTRPIEVGSLDLPDTGSSVYVLGKYAYVGNSEVSGDTCPSQCEFHIIDISDPTTPSIAGSLNLSSFTVSDIYISGKYAYVTTISVTENFYIIDISDPITPVIVGSLNLPSNTAARGVHVLGKYAYIVTDETGDDFHIIDISDPTAPIEVRSLNLPNSAFGVYVSGKYAYVVNNDVTGSTCPAQCEFHIIDLTGIDAPTANIGALQSSNISVTENITIGNDAYIGNGLVVGSGGILSQGGLSVSGGDIRHVGGSFLQTVGSGPTIVGSLNLPTSGRGVHISGKYAYVTTLSTGNDLHIIDISTPSTPIEVGSLNLPHSANSVYVSSKYAYVVNNNVAGSNCPSECEFHIIDVSDPSSPTTTGSLNLPDSGNDVYVSGKYAYVLTASSSNDFHIIDISDPTRPAEVGSLDLPHSANGVYVSGKYAYVVNDNIFASNCPSECEFHIIDISDPTTPVMMGSMEIPYSPSDVYVSGKYAYVVNNTPFGSLCGMSCQVPLLIIDISDPLSPTTVGSLDFSLSSIYAIHVAGKYAYLVTDPDGDDFHVVDISDPTNPVEVTSLNLPASTRDIFVSGKYAYVTTNNVAGDTCPSQCEFHIIDLTGIDAPTANIGALQSSNISVTENITIGNDTYIGNGLVVGSGGILSQGGLSVSGGDIRHTGGSLIQTVGSDPVIVGGVSSSTVMDNAYGVYVSGKYAYTTGLDSHTLSIVDISDNTNPTIVGSFSGVAHGWENPTDVVINGGHAYVTFVSSSLAIIDISDPYEPNLVGSISSSTLLFASSVYVSGRYAYVTSMGFISVPGSFSIIDISDPAAPYFVDSLVFSDTGASSSYVSGKYAYVVSRGEVSLTPGSLRIIDISDPTNQTIVGSVASSTVLQAANSVYVSGKYAYVASTVSDSLTVVDISSSTAPFIAGVAQDSDVLDGATSVHVSGKYAYVANNGDNSLRIIDISDPIAPTVVGGVKDATSLDGTASVFVSGKYAYVTAGGSDSLNIIDLTGIDAPTANIGALQSSNISVTDNLIIGNDTYIGNGLVVGSGGILSYGGFSFSNPSSTSYIAGSLVFGNASLDDDVILQLPNDASSTAMGHTWDTYSDTRIKLDQTSLNYGLSEILQLQPKRYTQKNSYWANGELILSGGNNTFGLIAQEVHNILPEIVSRPGDESRGLWGIDYSKLGPVLIRAIQEQQDQIDGLHFYLAGISTSSPTTLSEEELLFASNKPQTSALSYLSSRLASGATILKDFMAERITAVVGVFHRVKTKSIEMTDEETGELYCITIKQGEWHKRQGGCATDASSNSAILGQTITPSTQEESVVTESATPTSSPHDDMYDAVVETDDLSDIDVVDQKDNTTQDEGGETGQFISELVEKIKQSTEQVTENEGDAIEE